MRGDSATRDNKSSDQSMGSTELKAETLQWGVSSSNQRKTRHRPSGNALRLPAPTPQNSAARSTSLLFLRQFHEPAPPHRPVCALRLRPHFSERNNAEDIDCCIRPESSSLAGVTVGQRILYGGRKKIALFKDIADGDLAIDRARRAGRISGIMREKSRIACHQPDPGNPGDFLRAKLGVTSGHHDASVKRLSPMQPLRTTWRSSSSAGGSNRATVEDYQQLPSRTFSRSQIMLATRPASRAAPSACDAAARYFDQELLHLFNSTGLGKFLRVERPAFSR